MMQRGDIHYIIDNKSGMGSEQRAGRPAIIVSNDMCNAFSPVVEIVFLTTKPKNDLPTHVTIRSASQISTALGEQIQSVSTERVGDYIGSCTKQEMSLIDNALRISLDLEHPVIEQSVTDSNRMEFESKVKQLETERDMYKNMYNDILNNILNRR